MRLRKALKNTAIATTSAAAVLLNAIAFNHARRSTQYNRNAPPRKLPQDMSLSEKASALFWGVENPRPVNEALPVHPHETIYLDSKHRLESWYLPCPRVAHGTVLMFHGYTSNKARLLGKADVFLSLGYHVFLVDFRGSGGSEGDETSIGYYESDDVAVAYRFILDQGERNVLLYGISMGAVSILKAIHDYGLKATAIIIECPFESLYTAIASRIRLLKAPAFPMAGLLLVWGSVQNRFWAFGHKVTRYAKSVSAPILLLWGEKDPVVHRSEIDAVYAALNAPKALKTLPNAAHSDQLETERDAWIETVTQFITQFDPLATGQKTQTAT